MVEDRKKEKGYQNTEVGIIPEDWCVKLIEEVADVRSGKRLPLGKTLTKKNTPHPYIRVRDMFMGGIDLNEIHYVTEDVYPFIKNYRIFKEDIFISVAGSLGIVGKIPNQLDGANLTENADRLTNIKCNQDYLLYILTSSLIQNKIETEKTLGAQPKLALTRIRQFKIPLPTLKKEQTAIAEALNDASRLIAVLEMLINKKKQIRYVINYEYLTGYKRINGFDKKWEESSFESLCKVFTKQTGFDYSSYIKPNLITSFREGSIPFIQNKDFKGKTTNLSTDYFLPVKIAKEFPNILLNEKCLLISISGSIGNVGLFESTENAFLGGAIAIAKFFDKDKLDWVMYYLLSPKGQQMLLSKVKTGSHQNLILEDIRKMMIPIPTKEERNKIIDILADMDSEIDRLENKLNKFKLIKQGMMQNLLTGKIRLI